MKITKLPDGSAFFVASITGPRSWRKLWHKLFECPTFWNRKPAFTCPVCGAQYRCYWDGHDIEGLGINICNKCAAAHQRLQEKKP